MAEKEQKKECPSCAMMIPADSQVCPVCGYEFPARSATLKWVVVVLAVFLLLYFLLL